MVIQDNKDVWKLKFTFWFQYRKPVYSFISVVGGIYTVIKTKAPVTVDEWGEQYCLMGPYNEACVRTEVELMEPLHPQYKETIANMRKAGIKVRFL